MKINKILLFFYEKEDEFNLCAFESNNPFDPMSLCPSISPPQHIYMLKL